MPGSIFQLYCPGCRTTHEIHTGASYCWNHAGVPWDYEQYQCPKCRLLKSRQSEFCCREEGLVCETCGSDLEPWSGRVYFEEGRDGMTGPERVRGPCPKCGHELNESEPNAEGQLFQGLWD